MRRSSGYLLLTCALVIALGVTATITVKLYGEARSTTSASAQWKAEADGWEALARRSTRHDAVVSKQNRALVRRYNRLVASTETRQRQLLLAVQRAQQAATAKEAASAAAAAQVAADQPYSGSSSGSGAAAQAAPAAQPAPAQAPASAAS